MSTLIATGKPQDYCQEVQPSLRMTQLLQIAVRYGELTTTTTTTKNNKKTPTPPPPLGGPCSRGRQPGCANHSYETQAPRGDERAAAADWISRPEAQPIRCLGSRAIHESAERKRGGGERGVIAEPRGPRQGHQPSVLAVARPSQGTPEPGSAGQAGLSGRPHGQGLAASVASFSHGGH
jgi:hypothetical protein